MSKVQRQIQEALARATNPALFLSFGKDSLLLLKLLRDAGFNGPSYYFGELSKLAEMKIINDNLTVYSWPPADRYFAPNGTGLAQIDEYVVGNTLLPVVSPIVEGGNCTHGVYEKYTRPFKFPHDVTFTGYKKGETCDAVGVVFPKQIDIGVTTLLSPLFDWTDGKVIRACKKFGIEYEDSNTVEYCHDCLEAIKTSDWDRQAALDNFRDRFQFVH